MLILEKFESLSARAARQNEYVLDKDLYKATPEGTTEQLNNNTNIVNDAMQW